MVAQLLAPPDVSGIIRPALAPDVRGLVWNDDSAATANHAAIQDTLAKYGAARIPWPGPDDWAAGPSGDGPARSEALYVDDTIELENGNLLTAASNEVCTLTVPDGTNLDAVVASANAVRASGTPAAEGRGIRVVNVGIDGRYLDADIGPSSPVETQTSGLGHGIFLNGYSCQVAGCVIGQVRGSGIVVDTSSLDETGLGESIECQVLGNITKRTGSHAFAARDTAGVDHGVTDLFLAYNVFSHMNIRAHFASADSSTIGVNGAAVYADTAGGWAVWANHIYAADAFGSNYDGYPAAQPTHGMVLLTANGTRVFGNQIADFGYHAVDTTESYGLWLRQFSTRPSQVFGNNVWTDEDGAAKTRYAFRVNVGGGDTGRVQYFHNAAESRAGSPTMKGLKVDASGGGRVRGQLNGFLFDGMPIADQLTDTGDGITDLRQGLQMEGNSFANPLNRNVITHSSSGGLVADARLGHYAEVDLGAAATSVTVTNLPQGMTLEIHATVSGSTSRNFNLSSSTTAAGFTNPGSVSIAQDQVYRAVFVNVLGTTYLVDAGFVVS